MKNRILTLLFLVILGWAVLCPAGVFAAGSLDPAADASLTLYYAKDQNVFTNLEIGIYRVAEALPNGSFELIEPFAEYPINIHDITAQEQWQHIAETLDSYLIADGVSPDCEEKTDAEGKVCFSDLQTGLYFVREAIAENSDGTYIFNQFMVYLPTPQAEGTFDYDVEARPKCTGFSPKTKYTVTKLWQDAGNRDHRPEEVTVEIYKDGILQDTQILSTANNWSYTWQVSADDNGKWSVAESAVPDRYNVTIQQNQEKFSVINTYRKPAEQPPAKPPKTGDSASLLPWLLALCISGAALLILGVYIRRKGR